MTAATGKYGGRKVREGTVVSDKMEKTVVVAVASNTRHPLYKKTIRRTRHYMVHDEEGAAHMGDRVRIVESAPVSKLKRWRLAEVLRQVDLPDLAPGDIDLELLGEVKAEVEEAPMEPDAVAGPAEEEAAAPPAAVAMDEAAAPEAAETLEETQMPEAVVPVEPEVPELEETDVVEEDAAPEATDDEPAPDEEEAK